MTQWDAATLIKELTVRNETVAVAESLTGGGVLNALTSPPGASAVVRGGVVAYATDTKTSILGVDPALLARVGPVDPQVAQQLAGGVRTRFSATYGVGVTGVAGPEAQDGHPVGEVHVAVAGVHSALARTLDLAALADRVAIRQAAVTACLSLLARAIREEKG